MTFVSPRASSLSPQYLSLFLPCYPLHSPSFLIYRLRFLVASRSLACPHRGIRTRAPPGDLSTARTAHLSPQHGPRIDGTAGSHPYLAARYLAPCRLADMVLVRRIWPPMQPRPPARLRISLWPH